MKRSCEIGMIVLTAYSSVGGIWCVNQNRTITLEFECLSEQLDVRECHSYVS